MTSGKFASNIVICAVIVIALGTPLWKVLGAARSRTKDSKNHLLTSYHLRHKQKSCDKISINENMAFMNTTFCPSQPDGYRSQNYCYCTSQAKAKYPKFCHIECANFNFNLTPENGGCECAEFTAGPKCDRTLCHYTPSRYYADEYVQLYCMDNSTDTVVFENCTNIVKLGTRKPRSFPACPCLNRGVRLEESNANGNTSCVCTNSYYGDLCQYPRVYDRPSAVPTLIVVTILAVAFFILSLALWHRKRENRKMYAKMYKLEPIAPRVRRVPLMPSVPKEDEDSDRVGKLGPGPNDQSRRLTLMNLMESKRLGRIGRRMKKRIPIHTRKTTKPSNFENYDQGDQQAAVGGDDQNMASYSGGTGMGMGV